MTVEEQELEPVVDAGLTARWGIRCDNDVLTDVLLGSPANYVWLPTSVVARDSLKKGRSFNRDEACRQHDALRQAFEAEGIRVHLVPPKDGLPDIPFTRDTTAMTPWGLVGLNMHEPDRQPEVDHVLAYAESLGIPILGRIEAGPVEGGDICLARPDLLLLGCSGERTSPAGAAELAEIFTARGVEVKIHEYDSYFLHLDTFVGLLSDRHALVCADILDDEFLEFLRHIGLSLIDVTFKEMQQLAANVLPLGDGRVMAAAHNERVNAAIAKAGLRVIEVDITQFTLGGGGIHCLTMPLARRTP